MCHCQVHAWAHFHQAEGTCNIPTGRMIQTLYYVQAVWVLPNGYIKWWLFLLSSNNWWKLWLNTCIFIWLYGLLTQHLMANLNMMIGKETRSWHFLYPELLQSERSQQRYSSGNVWHLLDCLSKLERLKLTKCDFESLYLCIFKVIF